MTETEYRQIVTETELQNGFGRQRTKGKTKSIDNRLLEVKGKVNHKSMFVCLFVYLFTLHQLY